MKRNRIRLTAWLMAALLCVTMLPVQSFFGAALSVGEDKTLKLWYDEPAPYDSGDGRNGNYDLAWQNWSLPLGCGYMGVNAFGYTDSERLQITENSLCNYYSDSTKPVSGLNTFSATYLDFGHTNVTSYYRDLVLNDAIAHVRYVYNGVTYTREYFTSYPDKVLAIRLDASVRGALSFVLRPTIQYLTAADAPFSKTGTVVADTVFNDTITLSGHMGTYNTDFEGLYKVIPIGGTMVASNDENGENGTIRVDGADSAVILLTVGTNYEMTSQTFMSENSVKLSGNPAPHEKVVQYMAAASAMSYDTLRQRHVADYTSYFDAVKMNLGAAEPNIPTDELLAAYQNGSNEPYLEELYYQYGRYLLIASSREGCLPSNLQGIWNTYSFSPWSAGYWHNINVQMNYWPSFTTGLTDMFRSYVEYSRAYADSVARNADEYLAAIGVSDRAPAGTGENGWAIGVSASPYTITKPTVIGHTGPGSTGLTAQLFWDYYEYTQDRQVLAEIVYPTLYQFSRFLAQTLIQKENGTMLVKYSASPEQIDDGSYYNTQGCAFDQEMVFETLKNTLKSADILGVSDSNTKNWEMILPCLDPIKVGSSGQIKEYREENFYGDIGEYNHRHISQLVALMPGTSINYDTPAWLDAVKVTLNERGDKSTGWAMAHRLNAWARVGDGNRAYTLYQTLLKTGTLQNLWDTHPPFQIDGNFGGTAGVTEMLLQSSSSCLYPLAARPDAWSTGSYSGLTARGNFTVGAAWKSGQAVSFTVTSGSGNTCAVQYENIAGATVRRSDGKAVSFTTTGSDRIAFATTEGETYTISNIPPYTVTQPVDGLSCGSVGKNCVLRWTADTNAVSYNVYRAVNDEAVYTLIQSGVTDTAAVCGMEDLTSEDRCTFAVTAVSASGRESARATLSCATVTAPVSAQGNVVNGSLHLFIKESSNSGMVYRVYSDNGTERTLLTQSDYPFAVIPGYNAGATYSVTAVDSGRESAAITVNVVDYLQMDNVCLGKTVTLSSGNRWVNGSYPLSNCVDGSTETRFAVQDKSDAFSVTVNLGTSYCLNQLDLLEWEPDEAPTRSPDTTVQISSDQVNWTTVKTGFSLAGGQYVTVDMGKTVATYIRIIMCNAAGPERSACLLEVRCSALVVSSAKNNVCLNKPVSLSGNQRQHSSTYATSKCVDGDTTTREAVVDYTVSPYSITVDLEQPILLDSLSVLEWKPSEAETRSLHTTVEISRDKSTWTTVKSDFPLSGGKFVEVSMGQRIARYIRITMQNDGVSTLQCSLLEISCSSSSSGLVNKTALYAALQQMLMLRSSCLTAAHSTELNRLAGQTAMCMQDFLASQVAVDDLTKELQAFLNRVTATEKLPNRLYEQICLPEPALCIGCPGTVWTSDTQKDQVTVTLAASCAVDTIAISEAAPFSEGTVTVQTMQGGKWVTVLSGVSLSGSDGDTAEIRRTVIRLPQARNLPALRLVFSPGVRVTDLQAMCASVPAVSGDVDGDGSVTAADAMTLARFLAGWNSEVHLSGADVNADGAVTLSDLMYLLHKIY